MKKSLSILPMLLIITSMTFAKTFDSPSTSMAVLQNGATMKLLYKAADQTDVKVLIVNDNNRIVFSEKIRNTSGFSRPYNFSELPEGNYSIQLIDNTGRKIEHVNYKSEAKNKENKIMHVMRVSGTTDKFVLSVPNKGEEEITITIYDQDDVLYSGTESVSGDFAKIYNIKDRSGKITFQVTDSKGLTNSLSKDSW